MLANRFLAGRLRSPAQILLKALNKPAWPVLAVREILDGWLARLGSRPAPSVQQRANRAAAADLSWMSGLAPPSGGWARTEYGEYYATSTSVYAAIKLRAEALSRPGLVVSRPGSDGNLLPVGFDHPAQQLLDRVNPWYTRGDLWRATEIYLNLWGSSFWALERDEAGNQEIWPLRPDRVSVLPDRRQFIRGFVYMSHNGPVAYTPDEILWLRYFNPLEEFAGLSPIAPVRMAADMGKDALKFNRNFLRNSAQPDFMLLTNETMTDNEIEDFYNRWEARYSGPGNAHRPAIASFIRDIKTLGFTHRDMDFIQGLRWSLEEVSRTYGVPKPLLSDLERATFSNINAAERIFWRNTMLPEMKFLEEQLTRMLLPRLGYPDLVALFDVESIEALREDENSRVSREVQMLDRGVLTINEVRRSRKLPDVPWGDAWAKAPGRRTSAGWSEKSGPPSSGEEEAGVTANGTGPRVPSAKVPS